MTHPVPVEIAGYEFQCTPLRDADFNDLAAVYVILCIAGGGDWSVLDVGQSGETDERINNHESQLLPIKLFSV